MNESPKPDGLEERTLAVGRRSLDQLREALEALHHASMAAADRVVSADVEINEECSAIELALTQWIGAHAAGADAAFIVSLVHVLTDLERIGDHAEGIAKIALMLGPAPEVAIPRGLDQLGRLVMAMLDDGLTTLAARDADAARELCKRDDQVDEAYDALYDELLTTMMERREAVTPLTYLLWVAHNLERIADRVTNLCERTVYLATGELRELNTSNY